MTVHNNPKWGGVNHLDIDTSDQVLNTNFIFSHLKLNEGTIMVHNSTLFTLNTLCVCVCHYSRVTCNDSSQHAVESESSQSHFTGDSNRHLGEILSQVQICDVFSRDSPPPPLNFRHKIVMFKPSFHIRGIVSTTQCKCNMCFHFEIKQMGKLVHVNEGFTIRSVFYLQDIRDIITTR